MQQQPTSACAALALVDAYAALPEASHIFLLGPRRLYHVGTADILTLLIKMTATVTDFRGHRQTLYYLPGIISLIVTCIGIITK